ncbi:uncharacterized protein BDR25DRAFT_396931 [Lindgomyces ingoldianus]|uniref:Uncharacterized protein n=1 Tax=Lindgomyces ingoldianus TaxID=673940 RepID=A0ACB6QBL3_9PLEO|nr:uncharacterized protein BDR25DRAFT_396931 [Lindgomyces ingoldianus]KAF2463988.1 hypothetical protein BDR25DRAFT_396931 [Lindgomyces ingoldianus]
MSLSRRSSSSVPESSPPPYSHVGTSPPPFRSSPPTSECGAEGKFIVGTGETNVYTSTKSSIAKAKFGSNKLMKPKPLKAIPGKFEPVDVERSPESPRKPSHRKYCIAAIVIIAVLGVIAIVVGSVLPVVLKDRNHTASNTTTVVTSTVVSIVASQHPTSTPTPQPTLQPQQYLGGFDAVSPNNYAHMFYTDQAGNLEHIYDYRSTWQRGSPGKIATGVHPGSPVSASLLNSYPYQVHVFYVDNNNMVQGLFGTPSVSYVSKWFVHPVGSQQLKTSDSLFLRSCVASDSARYKYAMNASLYLYYGASDGSIQKFAFWNRTKDPWQHIDDLPDLQGATEVECQFARGIETLWTTNNKSRIISWYRSNVTGWHWKQGFTGTDAIFPATSLLSLSDASTNRTHIVFQNALHNLQRYELRYFGANMELTGNTVLHKGTPGTRLTTWANYGYCGISVELYYQRDNTSDLYNATFRDHCYSLSTSCYVTDSTSADQVVPLVQTYGKNVKHKHKERYAVGAIIGIIFASVTGCILLCCCCALCTS